jgi:hypothetical protein
MPFPALFGISVAFGLIVWGAVAWHFIWPALRQRPSPGNLKPILLLHAFRFLGLSFLVPSVVSSDLPAAFAHSVAYGDFLTATLALLALAALGTSAGIVATWIFNLFGIADLLFGFIREPSYRSPKSPVC